MSKFKNNKPPYKKVYFGINGQFGDIVMQEPGLRNFIAENPDTKIVLGCTERYSGILPLYENYHDNIIEFKAWEGYDGWPTEKDREYIEDQNFDAMYPSQIPTHDQPDWARYRHITEETALMLGVEAKTTNIEFKMPKDVVREPKTAAVHLFSSKWPGGARSVNIGKQNTIVKYLISKGYKVYQLSGPNQPHIKNTTFVRGTYFESCKKMLSTDFLITCDSGMPWVASAYNHPMIGLYTAMYNPIIGTTKNWQPVNPNAVYLESYSANSIDTETILIEIDKKIKENK